MKLSLSHENDSLCSHDQPFERTVLSKFLISISINVDRIVGYRRCVFLSKDKPLFSLRYNNFLNPLMRKINLKISLG